MNRDKPAKDNSRLYIGNLDPAIDEYVLISTGEQFKCLDASLPSDFIVADMRCGPKRGQPRGYCFLEYSSKQEALKAIDIMNNKMIKGRPLIVSFALAAPAHEDSTPRKGQTSSSLHRPNLLTVMKTQKMAKASTDAKIKAIEKKLEALQGSKKKAEEPLNDEKEGSTNGSPSEALSSLAKNSNAKKRYRPY